MCFLGFLFFCTACVPVQKKEYSLRKDMSDSLVANILYFQNNRLTDSIKQYFSHPDPTYRFYAARAFQSYTDDSVLDSLKKLLQDKEIEVANAAAYALGQSGVNSITPFLVESFDNADSLGGKTYFNATVLESVGKTGGVDELNLFTSISTFLPTDTTLYLGLLRGVLEFQLRDIYTEEADRLIGDVLLNSNYPEQVRLMATEIAYRSKTISLASSLTTFKRLIKDARSTDLKISYIKLLSKIQGKEVRDYLKILISGSPDIAVKAMALQILSTQPYAGMAEFLDSMVLVKEVQLRDIALDIILQKGTEDYAFTYQENLTKVEDPYVRAKLSRIIIRKLPFYYAVTKRTLRNKLLEDIKKARDPYLKAELYKALAEDAYNYDALLIALNAEDAIVRTTAALGIIDMLKSESLQEQFRSQTSKVKDEIYTEINKQLRDRMDDGLIYEIIQAKDKIEFNRLRNTLIEIKDKIELPQGLEAYNAICELADCTPLNSDGYMYEVKPSMIRQLDRNIEIVISMEQGDMELELYPEYAPFTVVAILDLIEQSYFNDKMLHRVVSQFVIQDGCPRGDGYGSLDFLLRTETPQVYFGEAGFIGMASAGRDTESSQWFITYKNTPHLNGNYTIFGKVTKGLEYIQDASVGSKINYIKIK